ncbi:MAG: biopolymer transporter ExbD [Nitrospirota bacterium]
MTGDLSNGSRRFMAEINVVPLVDVVLVLLIIFMITAPLLYRGIDIDLPQSAANTIKPDERVVVSVGKDHKIFVNKDEVPADRLEAAMKRLHDRNPDVTIYLRADQGIPYGIVVRVMDAVKKVGIDKLGMVTEPERRSP